MIRVLGLGQRRAGDDAAGLLVLDALEGEDELELIEVADTASLIDLLACDVPVVLVDAVASDRPAGEAIDLSPDDLAGLYGISTHGIDVPQAIGLARELAGDRFTGDLQIIGITMQGRCALSPEVAQAVREAADRIRAQAKTAVDASA